MVDAAKVTGYKFPDVTVHYEQKDAVLYALGVGAAKDPLNKSDLKFVYENHDEFQTLPTLGIVSPSLSRSDFCF